MLVNKKNIVLPAITVPVSRAAANGVSRAHFPHLWVRLFGWLARLKVAKSHPVVVEDYPAGRVREVENGHYRISEEEAMRDRAIDILSVNLIFPNR